MDDAPDAGEYPGYEDGEVRREGRGGDCDDGHRFVNAGGGVGHYADDTAVLFRGTHKRT